MQLLASELIELGPLAGMVGSGFRSDPFPLTDEGLAYLNREHPELKGLPGRIYRLYLDPAREVAVADGETVIVLQGAGQVAGGPSLKAGEAWFFTLSALIQGDGEGILVLLVLETIKPPQLQRKVHKQGPSAEEAIKEIKLLKGLLPRELCAKLIEAGNHDENKIAGKVYRKGEVTDPDYRRVWLVNYDAVRPEFRRWWVDILLPAVDRETGRVIEHWENPQLLQYEPGGQFKIHSDTHVEIGSGRVFDRDVSIVVWLNEGYGGGALSFPVLGLTVQGEPGDVTIFPSHEGYMHAAEPVTEGVRWQLVSWARWYGSPRESTQKGAMGYREWAPIL